MREFCARNEIHTYARAKFALSARGNYARFERNSPEQNSISFARQSTRRRGSFRRRDFQRDKICTRATSIGKRQGSPGDVPSGRKKKRRRNHRRRRRGEIRRLVCVFAVVIKRRREFRLVADERSGNHGIVEIASLPDGPSIIVGRRQAQFRAKRVKTGACRERNQRGTRARHAHAG